MDTFAGCINVEAEEDTHNACVKIMTKPGYFDLFTKAQKATTCTVARDAWENVKTNGESSGLDGGPPDVCAVLTSQVFQEYSWFVQDLSEGILGALTEKMSETIQQASQDAAAQKQEAEVKILLSTQQNDKKVKEMQKLASDIEMANAEGKDLAAKQQKEAN